MSVVRVGVGGTALRDNGRGKPRRHRFGLLFLLSLGGGGVVGMIAFSIIWLPTLFGAFQAPSAPAQIAASMIFPSPAAVQQTINVVDPPVYTAPRGGDGGGGGDD
jgi:hypothetical protein